jgi:hypothetical protein
VKTKSHHEALLTPAEVRAALVDYVRLHGGSEEMDESLAAAKPNSVGVVLVNMRGDDHPEMLGAAVRWVEEEA